MNNNFRDLDNFDLLPISANNGQDEGAMNTNGNRNKDESTENSDRDQLFETWKKIDFQKKCFLNLVLLVNLASVVLVLKYGFDIDVDKKLSDLVSSRGPKANTSAPTMAPTREWLMTTPLGQPIHVEQAFEKFGLSVKLASTGDVVAIGAPSCHKRVNNQGDFEWSGAMIVFSYDFVKDGWIPMVQPIRYTNAVERSDWSVDLSVSGCIIAVGCPVNDKNGEASGQVRVYEFNSNLEVRDREQKVNSIQGQDLGSWFGNTVSLSSDGNKVAATLWCDRAGLEPRDFGVRMFNYDFGERTWNQLGSDLPGKTRYDPYSTSVAMPQDNTILMTSLDLESG